MRVVTGKQMKQIEQNALAFDLTLPRLMENAGSAAAAYIRRTFRMEGVNCMVFCGTGNNGGDGFVVARKLFESGANVVVVLADGPPTSSLAQNMLTMLNVMEIPVFDLTQEQTKIAGFVSQADIVVDAIYGTGFHGAFNNHVAAAARLIGEAIAAVIALDVPSGLDCDKALACPGAVRADFTVVFDSLKPVHIVPSGLAYCGRVERVDIGIPDEARADVDFLFSELDRDFVARCLPPRAADSHKGDFGTVLAICGSMAYRGAAALAALGALRSGAGIVRIAAVELVCAAVAARHHEPVYLPLPHTIDGSIQAERAKILLLPVLQSASAIVFGCGLGDSEETVALLEFVLKNAKAPLIIDADGINALAHHIHVLQEASVPVILTPHPGEMARLAHKDIAAVQNERVLTAQEFAAAHGVIVVLKGKETLIASPDGRVRFNPTGGPGLAKGGSGDVLAGMIAAFCGQKLPPEDAAACAVYLHGLAGEETARRLSEYAMLPSELTEDLCAVLASFGR